MLLANRVAVVTGAGRGLGREIALAFAKEGADLVLAARTEEALAETAATVRAHGRRALVVPTDLRNAANVEQLAAATDDHFGRVDILVNNSGIGGPTAPLWEIEPEQWEETFAVNVTGTYLCARAFLPAMIRQGSGSIILIGSMTGKRPLWGRTPYAASKMALVGLCRSLAWETGPHGIRVNLISPGPIAGERLDAVIERQASTRVISVEAARRQFTDSSPLGRVVVSSEVAAAAVYLASDLASSITGQDLNASAGAVMY